jgi:hypothetical protein
MTRMDSIEDKRHTGVEFTVLRASAAAALTKA